MNEFAIQELAKIINSRAVANSGFFAGVNTDSRTVKQGECFFAIKGERFDGNDYVGLALEKGAACAVVDCDYNGKQDSEKILRVKNTVKALGQFAAEYRKRAGFKVAAITGSAGKTTTRQIAYHVLKHHFRTFTAPKNFNNNIGLPLTLLAADESEKIVVAELGTNSPGEIACLSKIASPDIALITNVYPVHLEGLGSLENIADEKLSISEGLEDTGRLILNGDCRILVETAAKKDKKFITFGQSDGCDIKIKDIETDGLTSSFTLNGCGICLSLPGAANISNTAAAFAICSLLEVKSEDFAGDLKDFSPVSMRAELMQIGKLMVLNDCYNASPASMKNALDIITQIGARQNRRRVFICGDMRELGQYTDELHAELGGLVVEAGVEVLITSGSFAKVTAETAKKKAKYKIEIKSFDNTVSACDNLQKFIKDTDIVLVKGSRANKLELVIKKLEEIFAR